MEIKKISRGFKQTIQVELPDGRSVWLSHEAEIEAEISEEETSRLAECYDDLERIIKEEVVSSIREQKAIIDRKTSTSTDTSGNSRARL
jgi:hypothetical protein